MKVTVIMLQVPYGAQDRDKPLIRLPFTFFAVVTVCLPLLGLITCITVSLLYHYNEATYTHCQVCMLFFAHFLIFIPALLSKSLNSEWSFQCNGTKSICNSVPAIAVPSLLVLCKLFCVLLVTDSNWWPSS